MALPEVPFGKWVQAFEKTGSKPGDGSGIRPYRMLYDFGKEEAYLWTVKRLALSNRPIITISKYLCSDLDLVLDGWLWSPDELLVLRIPKEGIFLPVN